jgi:hypothetical protein
VLYQSPTLEKFLLEFMKLHEPPFKSEVDDVHEERLFAVWGKNPLEMDFGPATSSSDGKLSKFAAQFDESWKFADMRNVPIGMGFSWGRFGPNTEIRRMGSEPVFAYRKPPKEPGFMSKLFGKKG